MFITNVIFSIAVLEHWFNAFCFSATPVFDVFMTNLELQIECVFGSSVTDSGFWASKAYR